MHIHPHKHILHKHIHRHIHRHRHRHRCTLSSNLRLRFTPWCRLQFRLRSTLLRSSRRQRRLKLSLLQNQRSRLHPLPIACRALNPPTDRPSQSRFSAHDLNKNGSKVCQSVPRLGLAQSLATPTLTRPRRIEPRDLRSVSTPWRLTQTEP
jgi:hypothetical protein